MCCDISCFWERGHKLKFSICLIMFILRHSTQGVYKVNGSDWELIPKAMHILEEKEPQVNFGKQHHLKLGQRKRK